jgi:hypothetical protein
LTSIYNKDLKLDSVKMQIIQEYYGNNKSSYEISRELGIPARTIQNFLAKDTHKGWHLENEEIIDKYFNGFGGKTVGDMIQGLRDDPLADIFKGTWLECKDDSVTPADIKGSFEWPASEHQIGIWPPYKSDEEDEKLFEAVKQITENLHNNREDGLLNHYGQPIPRDQWEGLGFSVKKKEVVDNSRILLISDLHVPYHHKDSIKFLQHLKDKYNPTRIICLGDEVDHLALSYHEKETEAPSAFDELKMALPVIKQIEQMFPVMDILDSNHGSLAYRKAKTAGIPKHYLKSYADVLQVGEGWKWHFDMVIDLPTGQKCYLHHGKSSNITKTSQAMSMCSVAGHYHNTFKIEYWANPIGLYWGMQAGCLIDDKSFAFNYNNVNLHRPLIGTGLIINGLPILEPMVLDSEGNWIGK